MLNLFRSIISANRKSAKTIDIGISRTGLPIAAGRWGSGQKKISLIAGMHADEPAGPLLLRYLSGYLSNLPESHPLLKEFSWWIVPHGNPDGEEKNALWYHHADHVAEVGPYLRYRVRELPGDDLEFGFPRNKDDNEARPETTAIYNWWLSDSAPFSLHMSLHGMGFAGGCWYLLQPDSSWMQSDIQRYCTGETAKLHYVLHDVERNGEKGFTRIAPGFCTHPTSVAMKEYFLAQGDSTTAALFRPSSMETIRSFGGNPLTLVSELPLFILPGVGLEPGPPDPVAVQWHEQIALWGKEIGEGISPEMINVRADASGINAMPFNHQMQLQWTFLVAALETVAKKEMSVIDS